ncbi:hypothetical protein NIES4072_60320 [Nostoc commune NIES-4072]|uniref:Uncharacterized protein n=1 Tax=Nostoc commune NIES-4072 TaxID=2005467 RepID=A0A2R5G3B8_NOSCO|nr:hypothetical protein NIES4070_30630 [Nostoc commune HK-02]GBG22324.1 hypothetical protein NIES4072_60320 [Nostoc commune NIES-4072]
MKLPQQQTSPGVCTIVYAEGHSKGLNQCQQIPHLLDSWVERTFRAKVGVEKGEIRQANQSPPGIHWEDRTWWVGFLLEGVEGLFGT